jgi:hypothetical protein
MKKNKIIKKKTESLDSEYFVIKSMNNIKTRAIKIAPKPFV